MEGKDGPSKPLGEESRQGSPLPPAAPHFLGDRENKNQTSATGKLTHMALGSLAKGQFLRAASWPAEADVWALPLSQGLLRCLLGRKYR